MTDKNLVSGLLFADAVMLIETRRDIDYLSDIPENSKDKQPEFFKLLPAYPNPFNASTNFRFALKNAAKVQIKVFNILGQLLWYHSTEKLGAGQHRLQWNAQGFPSGIYLYAVSAENTIHFGKIALIK